MFGRAVPSDFTRWLRALPADALVRAEPYHDSVFCHNGRPIALSDLPRLSALLRDGVRSPSEYSLPNLYLYRHRHAYRWIDGAVPIIVGRTYDGERHALPLAALDAGVSDQILEAVDCIFPLDETEARGLADAGGFLVDDRDADADYLYDCGQLAQLEAARTKRGQAAAFDRLGPDIATFESMDARAVLGRWIADAGRGPDHADAYECEEAIACRAALELEGFAVRLGSDPIGFLLAGPVRDGERIVHFAKARRDLPALTPGCSRISRPDRAPNGSISSRTSAMPALAQAKRAPRPDRPYPQVSFEEGRMTDPIADARAEYAALTAFLADAGGCRLAPRHRLLRLDGGGRNHCTCTWSMGSLAVADRPRCLPCLVAEVREGQVRNYDCPIACATNSRCCPLPSCCRSGPKAGEFSATLSFNAPPTIASPGSARR